MNTVSASSDLTMLPGMERKPRTYAVIEQELIGIKRKVSDAAEHTYEASFLLLRQSNSLDEIPTHDQVCDANVDAIRALAARLLHAKSTSEAIEISHQITRHCDGYDLADRAVDAEVQTVTTCNVEARVEVRSVTAVFDGGLQRRPRRSTSSARGKAGQ